MRHSLLSARRPLAHAALLALAASLSACAFLRHLVGRDTVDLEKADIRSMGVDIRKEQKTICPRERVQLAVFAEVVLDGDAQVRSVETWQGTGGDRNGKLDFDEFAFHTDDGTIDAATGWFSPKPDLLATVGREIAIRTVFKRRPDKFSFTTTYKPDYDCIKATGRDAAPGRAGAPGANGANGSAGTSGMITTTYRPSSIPGGMPTRETHQGPGGNGGNGGPGGPGGRGSDGEAGIRLRVELALVKTPFYDKLVAARIAGDTDDFLLFPPEVALSIRANGGAGGAGGPGGRGGDGGPGGSGDPPGINGQRGPDGPGGPGGNGGPGGTIELVYDAKFEADLRAAVHAEAHGGAAGPGGAGGGASGSSGHEGRISWTAGDVRARFASLDGVTVLR
jgi:hypothetical protein